MNEIKEDIGCDCNSCGSHCGKKVEPKITLDKGYFEHLLNCLANQKFIGEAPPCGDAMAMDKNDYLNIQRENQEIIDKAWNKGMFILSLDIIKKNRHDKLEKEYVEFWNKNVEKYFADIEKDRIDFPKDENIDFKWKYLVDQEIKMWISLCCYAWSTADEDNQTYIVGQVSKEDYDHIVERRGFTPRMIHALNENLKAIGIGLNLPLNKWIE